MNYLPTYTVKDLGSTYEVELDDEIVSGLWEGDKDVLDDKDEDDLQIIYELADRERREQGEQHCVDNHLLDGDVV